MTIVAGIRFKPAGKVYYFDPGDLELPVETGVIVETARGVEYGTVVVAPREVSEDQVVQPLKQVIRCATADDLQQLQQLQARNEEAMLVARERIVAHGLDMHLVEVESTFDASKLIFQFTAEHRVDFRELVRDLAGRFRTRIELRQIGVRDEAKLLGGIGMCGRELCCSTWMTEFMPVSIRMAKDQNLSLNPAKISGVCGRLLCCLRFELDPEAKGKSHQELAKEPSLADRELAQALQEDMLAAVESAPTRDEAFTAVSMPRPVRAPQPQAAPSRPQPTAASRAAEAPRPVATPEVTEAARTEEPTRAASMPRADDATVADETLPETPRTARPGPVRLPRLGSAPARRPTQTTKSANSGVPATEAEIGDEAEPPTAPGTGRSRRRRRGRRGGAGTGATTAASTTGEQPRQRPRRRSRRGSARPSGSGGTSGPAGSAGPTPE